MTTRPFAVNRLSGEIIDSDQMAQPSSQTEPLTRAQLDSFLKEHKLKISDKAPEEEKYKLARLLHEFSDIFALNVTEMKSYSGEPFEIKIMSDKRCFRR